MKNILILFSVICLSSTIQAQSEAEILMDMFELEKKTAIAEFMGLSEGRAVHFWEIYNDYESKRKKISKERVDLIKDYAANYSSLTDEKIDKMVNEMISIQEDELALRVKYYKKIKKELGGTVAGKFFQAEDAINTMVKASIYDDLPMLPDKK
ncbi:hypothetical protein OO013_11295 [Mangrovivirga sp. M17]|uniref:Uncharacterized protein n=1 Tax=Mangrovivirga halotolerans TaxID=2993936 RepID=A0ABT3RRP0_9BACT|nr:hypothetical protein [Mangrovivirga halotolerans]MCX2744455.1 hypothetical protein [Mangrovivirga halotolerans]